MADTPPSQLNAARPGPGGDAGRDAGGQQQAQGLAHAHAHEAQALLPAHDKPDTAVPDLATADGVRAYLAGTAFAGAEVSPLSGGTANFVYRLTLRAPHDGHSTLVLKHAKGYVKDHPGMAFEVERQVYEVAALQRVHAWLARDAVVTVPAVFLFDETAHVIVMEDTGAASTDLKTLLKSGTVSPTTAAQIGAAAGTFLAALHAWGKGNVELCATVAGNEQAKRVTAWAFYGRLESTLVGPNAPPKLCDPPLDVAEEDLVAIRRIAEETTRACLEVDDTFVMGDFWPGNLMVRLDAAGALERIYVVDWELAKAGLHGVELGQFCAEMHLLRRCYPEVCGETASAALQTFLEAYKPDGEVARSAVVRWGTHMVVLGARVEWGDKATSRAVVLEGVRYVVDTMSLFG